VFTKTYYASSEDDEHGVANAAVRPALFTHSFDRQEWKETILKPERGTITFTVDLCLAGPGKAPPSKENAPARIASRVAGGIGGVSRSEFSDFYIESCEGERFPAHRFMLASVSDVMAAMLGGHPEMLEARSGVLKLTDFTSASVKVFLDFVYVHWVEDFCGTEYEVVRLADKYNVADLLTRAIVKVEESMDVDTVLPILELTWRVAREKPAVAEVRRTALEYMHQNHEAVRALPEWKELDKELVSF
jgi:hypothetical protein